LAGSALRARLRAEGNKCWLPEAVHRAGPASLFAAFERAGIRRVIHLSAIRVNRGQPTAFSQSKIQGDAALNGPPP